MNKCILYICGFIFKIKYIIPMNKLFIGSFILALLICLTSQNVATNCQAEGCQVCSTTGFCIMCKSDYLLTINKQLKTTQCIQTPCTVQNCFRCISQNACAQCQLGFTLTSESTCAKVNVKKIEEQITSQKCLKRLTDGKCAECARGFELRSGECQFNFMNYASQQVQVASPCQPNATITSCTACISPNFCTACSNNLIPSASGTSCITNCNNTVSNCLLCSTSTTCMTCINGYTLNTTTNLCISCPIQGCQYCQTNNTCTNCYFGYVLNATSNQCNLVGCRYPCLTCNSTNPSQCLTCDVPFSSIPFLNGTCFTCSVANCIKCSNVTVNGYLNNCLACQANYTLSGDNLTCVYNCNFNGGNLCTSCTGNICNACVPGYTPATGGNGCTACTNAPICTQCQSTNVSICLACIPGYFVNVTTCSPCAISSCAVCTTNGTICTQYMASANLQVYTAPTTTYAYVCDNGCAQCLPTFPLQCTQCSPGYTMKIVANMNIAYCIPCSGGCMTCLDTNPSYCLSCFATGYLTVNTTANTSVCVVCSIINNCYTCSQTDANFCTTCPAGYYLAVSSDGKSSTCTTACPSNCLTCFNAAGTTLSGRQPNDIACSSCLPGFGLSPTGACLPCLVNCRYCSGQFQNICNQCADGFYLAANLSCAACPPGCQACSPAGCTTCITGYIIQVINASTICLPPCVYPCIACNPTNQTICQACAFGYLKTSNGSCQLETNFNLLNYCGVTTFLNTSSGQCQPCTGANCWRCNATNPNQCYTCGYNNYLNTQTGQCLPCSQGCLTCSSPTNCTQCSFNYTFLNSVIGSNTILCQPCAAPCAQCFGNPQTCTSCLPGFTFTGWNCISNFYYQVSFAVIADQSTFFQNYQSVTNQLTAAMQTKNQRGVSVISINSVNNSTNMIAYLTTLVAPNTDNATYEFNNLVFALTTGNEGQFAGMSLINQTVTAQGGNIVTIGSSTPMIVGIVVPISVLIIMAIFYFIFSRSNIDLPGSSYEPMVSQQSSSARQNEMRSL